MKLSNYILVVLLISILIASVSASTQIWSGSVTNPATGIANFTDTQATAQVVKPVVQGNTSTDNIDQSLTTFPDNSISIGVYSGTTYWECQNFTPTKSKFVGIQINKSFANIGTPTADLLFQLVSDPPTSTSTVIASNTLSSSTYNAASLGTIFTINLPAILDTTKRYAIIIKNSTPESQSGNNMYQPGAFTTNLYSGGQESRSTNFGASWVANAGTPDVWFRTLYAKNTEDVGITVNGVNLGLISNGTAVGDATGILSGAIVDTDKGFFNLTVPITSEVTAQSAVIRAYSATDGTSTGSPLVLNRWANYGTVIVDDSSPTGRHNITYKINTMLPMNNATLSTKLYSNGAILQASGDGVTWYQIYNNAAADGYIYPTISVPGVAGNSTVYIRFDQMVGNNNRLYSFAFNATLNTTGLPTQSVIAGTNYYNISSNGRADSASLDPSMLANVWLMGQGATAPTAPTATFTSTNISIATNTTSRGWEGVTPFTMKFTNTSTGAEATSWVWNYTALGSTTPVTFNSTPPTVYNPVHTFTNQGNYSIKLNVTNSVGTNISTQTTWINVTSGNIPIASFTQNKTSGAAPLAVLFTDTSSNSPKVWNWSVNASDWSTRTWYNYTTSTNLVQTFSTAGIYNVTLSVSNITESTTISTVQHDVLVNSTLVADFAGAPLSGFVPQDVSFVDMSSGEAMSAWTWDFGDGVTSILKNPTHTYVTSGVFSVTHTVTGADGVASKTIPNYVSIGTGNIFTGNQTSNYKYSMPVIFNSSYPGGQTGWLWNFGDGYTATTTNATHHYSVAGAYTVSLAATDALGTNTSTRTNYINLYTDDDTNLKSYLRMNGADGGTTFTGEKGNAWTASSVTTSTTQKKFGTASALFNAAGDHLDTASSSIFDFGTGDFTIEMWVYPTSTGTNNLLITRATNALNTGWGIYHGSGATSTDWHFYGGSTATATPAFTLPLNTWSHLAVQRVRGSVTPYVNGVAATAPTTLAGNYDTTNAIRFGDTGGGVISYQGYVDEFRLSTTPRWDVGTGSFSTPYAEYRMNLSTNWVEANPGSTMRYKTNPDFPGAVMSNITPRYRTLQVQNINITDRINATMIYNPNHFFGGAITANTSMLAGITVTYSSVDNNLGEVMIGLDRVGGFTSVGQTDSRLSVADIRMTYWNYTEVEEDLTWDEDDNENTQYFANGFLTNATTNLVFPVHHFTGTNVTVTDWVTYSNFVANNTAPVLAESPVQFMTNDNNQTANRWLWNFGDGTTFLSHNTSVVYTYPLSSGSTPKTVSVQAYLWQNNSVTNTTTKVGYVTPVFNASYVKADFSGDPLRGSTGLAVTFTDLSEWGTSNALSGRTYNWSFGDDLFSSTPYSNTVGNTAHVYTALGTYTVKLTVNNTIANSTEMKYNYIIISTSQSNTALNLMYPKDVNINILDTKGNNQAGCHVSVVMLNSTVYATNWYNTLLGVPPTADPIQSTYLDGLTDSEGQISFPMSESGLYTLTATNATSGISLTKTFYPTQDKYSFIVATTATAPTLLKEDYITGNLTAADGVGLAVNLNLSYTDILPTTTSISFYVNDGNGTRLYDTVGVLSSGKWNATYSATNTKSRQYVWGYYADTILFGNVSDALGITMKGTGMYLDIAPCTDSHGVPYATGWGNAC